MRFATKLITSALTIGFTVFAGIWTGFEKIDNRMDKKVSEGKKEVLLLVDGANKKTDAVIKAQDEKVSVQLLAIRNEMGEVRKDVRVILGIARKSQVFVEKKANSYYTNTETHNSKGNHL